MDKNKAVVDYLLTCPYVQNNPLFYNFGKEESDNTQIVTLANDTRLNTPFIDGSVKKLYTFTIIIYKSVAYRAVVNREGVTDENIDNAFEAQQVIDWVDTQEESRNYPDFGTDCIIDKITAVTDQPNLNGVDRSTTPALAKYSISIKIEYIDCSKVIWN